ncbi:hypothetical protein [Enterobacter sp.]|uniref:hypothetical protein n=1 Tax=Enterobacter sp. TaxID=42895 RepID=UPI00296F9FA0|nr:hypothetical protein [Enterobacter sp.]
MNKVKAYTASPTDMSPPVDDKSFCVDFVLATDYQAMQSERDQLAAQLADVVAENAALKEEISNITFMRDDDFFGSTQRAQEVMGRLVNVKTPATDRFLAEQRAVGVEMLAEHLSGMRISASETSVREFAAQLRNEVKG